MKTLLMFAVFSLPSTAQDMSSCPMHKEHMTSEHQVNVEKHGDLAMGFPHDKTTHHFWVLPDGGAIEITVNDPKDTDDLQSIRMHLKHITMMFSNGDFSIPMFIHAEAPPGVAENERSTRRDHVHCRGLAHWRKNRHYDGKS
jgi:hypothetical protein